MPHAAEGALHAYLDGAASAAERAELDAHLAHCELCRVRLSEERALRQRAGELLDRVQPPERALPPLHAIRARRRRPRWLIPLSWAATVVLAVGLGYYARGEDERIGTPVDEIAVAPAATETTRERVAAPEQRQQPAPARTPPPVPSRAETAARPSAPPAVSGDVAAAARPDTGEPTAAAGAVALRDQVPQRPAAPTARAEAPREAAALAAEAPAANLARVRRIAAAEWRVISPSTARDVLGTDPVGVAGLTVRQIRTSPATGGPATILIEQAVDATTVIQLYQRRSTTTREADLYGTSERLARYVGGLRVEIAGPLSEDSLNRLLEQLQPLP